MTRNGRTLKAIAAEVKAALNARLMAQAERTAASNRNEPPDVIAEYTRKYEDAKRAHMDAEVRANAERQVKRDAKRIIDEASYRKRMEMQARELRAKFPDRSKLIGALEMLRNDNDGETLNAARAIERIRTKVGYSWSQLIVQEPGVK